jgi:hypothetical protein
VCRSVARSGSSSRHACVRRIRNRGRASTESRLLLEGWRLGHRRRHPSTMIVLSGANTASTSLGCGLVREGRRRAAAMVGRRRAHRVNAWGALRERGGTVPLGHLQSRSTGASGFLPDPLLDGKRAGRAFHRVDRETADERAAGCRSVVSSRSLQCGAVRTCCLAVLRARRPAEPAGPWVRSSCRSGLPLRLGAPGRRSGPPTSEALRSGRGGVADHDHLVSSSAFVHNHAGNRWTLVVGLDLSAEDAIANAAASSHGHAIEQTLGLVCGGRPEAPAGRNEERPRELRRCFSSGRVAVEASVRSSRNIRSPHLFSRLTEEPRRNLKNFPEPRARSPDDSFSLVAVPLTRKIKESCTFRARTRSASGDHPPGPSAPRHAGGSPSQPTPGPTAKRRPRPGSGPAPHRSHAFPTTSHRLPPPPRNVTVTRPSPARSGP